MGALRWRFFRIMRTFFAIVSLLVLLGTAIAWAIWAFQQMPDVKISGHGYAAMLLGIIFTLLVGCGLVGLLFYSSRHRYDEPPDLK
jgi:membrane protein YdbS with pleckstrin-like domain